MGVNTDGEETGPGSTVTDGVKQTQTACKFEQQHENGQSLTQDPDCDEGIQGQKPAKGTDIPLITSLQNMSLQHTSGALNTEHNEAQIQHTDGGDSVLSNTLVTLNADTSAYDKCVKLGECSSSPQLAEILETDTNDAWYKTHNTLNEISLSDASVFKQELPYRAKKTGIPLITPLQNMQSQHISGGLNTKHNEAQIEHAEGGDSVLSNTPTSLQLGADIEDEKTELSHGALVKLNTDTAADDKCVKSEECSSSLQPGEIMEILEADENDDWDAMYNTLLDEITPSDESVFKLEQPLNPDTDQLDKEGYTPLYKAALEGHLEDVNDLISRGENTNKPSQDGLRPLHAAAQEGHARIVDFLILQGADVSGECERGQTPLHTAAANGYVDILESFIAEGPDLNQEDNTGWTPFNAAVQYGHLEAVKYLTTKGAKQNRYDGMTPLYAAARFGHLDIVNFFITKGADVNEENEKGKIPLHIAAAQGHINIMKYLFMQGSDVNKGDAKGWTPFNAAVQYGHLEGIKYLVTKGAKQNRYDGMTPLYVAAEWGHLDIIKFFISNGADVNEEDEDRMIPLHGAAALGHSKVVEYLIQQGSDVNKKDNTGWTPFNAAVKCSHREDTKYLFHKGAKQNRYNEKSSPFCALRLGHLDPDKDINFKGAKVSVETYDDAAVFGHVKVMEFPIQQGSDVDKKENTGWTSFIAAVQEGHREAVKYLMTEGAEQNRYDRITPFCVAAEFGHLHFVEYLISNEVDVSKENEEEMIPLLAAAICGNTEVMKYLNQQESDENKSDCEGKTLLNSEVHYGHLEAAKYFVTEGVKQDRYAGENPLNTAAGFGHLDIVKFFISNEVDVSEENEEEMIRFLAAAICGNAEVMEYLNQQVSDENKSHSEGWTPFNAAVPNGHSEAFKLLHGAAARGHMKNIEYLIQQGSHVNKTQSWTPFNIAVKNGHLEAVKCLRTKGANQNRYKGKTPLYVAAYLGHLHIVKYFISKGADVNEEDESGKVPLHGAATRGHSKIMEYLIQQGSDVNYKNNDGWTSLNIAVQNGHLEAVKCLRTKGAHQNRYKGKTPLYVAAYLGHLHIVEYFISKGADVNEEDESGKIPLHGAAAGGRLKIMEYLIQQGSDVNKKANTGWTPFNAAVQNGHLEGIKYLVTKGAKQNRYAGMTPLYATSQLGHLDIVKFFIDKGADVNEEIESGKIPLHGAAARCRLEVLEYLIQQGSDVDKKDNTGLTSFNAAVKNGHLEAIKYLMTKGANQNRYDGKTPLCVAAYFGHLQIVEYFLSNGADVNEIHDRGLIPLHGAATRGHIEVMEYLIQQGSDVNKKDKTGWTPFNAALKNGHLEAIKYLMTEGAKQNKYAGMNPLYAAAKLGHLHIVKFFLSKGVDVNEENDTGRIALHGAAIHGNIEVMKYLIQQGSNVNKGDLQGLTPFNAAVQYGHLKAVQYLMTEGVEQNRYDGMTPLYAAAQFGHLDTVKLLISNGAEVNEEHDNGKIPLHDAAARGQTRVMEYLIQQGSHVNKKDNTGRTPFNAAVQYGHLEAVKYLLTKGAKQNIYDSMTPLHAAAQVGHLDIVKFLVSNGADVNEETSKGLIPLHGAAIRGHMKVLEYLIQQGSDTNKEDNTGWTPFNAAVQYGHVAAARYLMSKGAKQNRYDGMTPIYAAAYNGHLDIIQFFISNGANVNEENDKGKIPLHGAAVRGHMKVMEYLIQQGMNVNKNDYRGWTPLHAAVKNGHLEVFKLFLAKGAQGTRFEGLSPLYITTQYDHVDVVKFLDYSGYDVKKRNECGTPPLHAGCYNGNIDIVELLVHHNANVNEQDHDHVAAQEGHQEIVDYLTLNETDLSLKDIDGLKPQQVAAYKGYPPGGHRNLITRGCMTVSLKNADTQSRTGKVTSKVDNAEDRNDCSSADNVKRGTVELSLKNLSTRTHDDDKDEAHSNLNKHLSQRRGDPNEEDTGDPLSQGHHYGAKHFATRGYAAKKKVFEMKETYTQSRTGLLASQVDNAEGSNDCSRADNVKRGADKLFLKNLHTKVEDDGKAGNGEHNPFSHAKLKYPDKGEQDSMLDQMEAIKPTRTRKRDTITNGTDCSSPHDSGCDSPFLQTMENDGHPSEEPESRGRSRIDENRQKRESSSPMNTGNGPPFNGSSTDLESFPTHPPAVDHQKLSDGNPVSTHGTSSNPVRNIETKRRSSVDRCPSILALVQTFLQMIIALAIILAGSPVLVAGNDITERVTLKAGKPGVVPFHLPWPSNSTSHGVPYYTLRFESQRRPFDVNGGVDIEGFKNPSQIRRFTSSFRVLDTSPCVNLMINNVDTVDEDGYVLTAIWYSFEPVLREVITKEIDVQIPPGPAKCYITLSKNSSHPYEVHCRATSGSVKTTISCYQNDRKIDVKGDITDDGQVTSGIFWLPDNTYFSCCSHDVTSHVNETMCNDYEWPPGKESTTQTVDTVPTSVANNISKPVSEHPETTPTPQIESHIESGACRQFMLPCLWHFTYLSVYILAFVTIY